MSLPSGSGLRAGRYLYKREPPAEPDEEALGVTWVPDLDEVLKASDYVIIAANYNPSTHLLIGEREFRLMKPTAFFVNTGRGRIVDEPALLKALREKWIAGAGLDVYWHEPPVSEPAPPPELFTMDNVILTPHIGSATPESRRLMSAAQRGEHRRDGPWRAPTRHRQSGGLRLREAGPRPSDRLFAQAGDLDPA